MNAPSPTIAIIANPGMPIAVKDLGNIMTEIPTKQNAMTAIPMANFKILVKHVGSYKAI